MTLAGGMAALLSKAVPPTCVHVSMCISATLHFLNLSVDENYRVINIIKMKN